MTEGLPTGIWGLDEVGKSHGHEVPLYRLGNITISRVVSEDQFKYIREHNPMGMPWEFAPGTTEFLLVSDQEGPLCLIDFCPSSNTLSGDSVSATFHNVNWHRKKLKKGISPQIFTAIRSCLFQWLRVDIRKHGPQPSQGTSTRTRSPFMQREQGPRPIITQINHNVRTRLGVPSITPDLNSREIVIFPSWSEVQRTVRKYVDNRDFIFQYEQGKIPKTRKTEADFKRKRSGHREVFKNMMNRARLYVVNVWAAVSGDTQSTVLQLVENRRFKNWETIRFERAFVRYHLDDNKLAWKAVWAPDSRKPVPDSVWEDAQVYDHPVEALIGCGYLINPDQIEKWMDSLPAGEPTADIEFFKVFGKPLPPLAPLEEFLPWAAKEGILPWSPEA
jgi:hypothetical protein